MKGNCTPKERTFHFKRALHLCELVFPCATDRAQIEVMVHWEPCLPLPTQPVTLSQGTLGFCMDSRGTAWGLEGCISQHSCREPESHPSGLRLFSTCTAEGSSEPCLSVIGTLSCLCLMFIVKQKLSLCWYFSSFNSPATEKEFPPAAAPICRLFQPLQMGWRRSSASSLSFFLRWFLVSREHRNQIPYLSPHCS